MADPLLPKEVLEVKRVPPVWVSLPPNVRGVEVTPMTGGRREAPQNLHRSSVVFSICSL